MQGCDHEPTRESRAIVTTRTQRGSTHAQIAEYLEICENTLRLKYSVELRVGKEDFTDMVFGKLAEKIQEGSEKSIHFYLTHKSGWRSADKMAEVDALKENTLAITRKAEADALTAQLRGHMSADAELVSKLKDERG